MFVKVLKGAPASLYNMIKPLVLLEVSHSSKHEQEDPVTMKAFFHYKL